MEKVALAIGKVDEAIKKSIRALKEMGKGDSEILMTILPWMELQEKLFESSEDLQELIQTNLILNEKDCLEYMRSIDGKERDEELLQAASWIDGYMKQHRRELLDVEQLAFYVAIRELVNLLDNEFKELNKEQIKVLISTEADWKRYQSIPEDAGQIEDQ